MKKALARTLFTCCMMLVIKAQADRGSRWFEIEDVYEDCIIDTQPIAPQIDLLIDHNKPIDKERSESFWDNVRIEQSTLIIPIKQRDSIILASNEARRSETPAFSASYKIVKFPRSNILRSTDGSEWIFEDPNISNTWKPGEQIVISPKDRWIWGSNFSYTITNIDRGTSVDVNFFLGPKEHVDATSWIYAIDTNNNHVYISNGKNELTVWEVSHADFDLFKDWEVNDTLIIGRNDNWVSWFSSFDHILVNVNTKTKNYIRARFISTCAHRFEPRGGYAS